MSITITIKLTLGSKKLGPFTIKDQAGNIIEEHVERDVLMEGYSYIVSDSVSSVTLVNEGSCNREKTKPVEGIINTATLIDNPFETVVSTCMWRHLTNPALYNNFYGETEPYIIEYPFVAASKDEIVQNIKDYSKVFKYIPDGTGVFNNYEKIELDDVYFNKMIVYSGQQNSGLLELVKKPKNNLAQYNTYPIYRELSKVVTYTKSDSYYNTNIFWDVVKDKTIPQFITDCNTLSLDKTLNQSNMDYSKRSFNKSPIRAKDIKVRMILDNKSDTHIVSQHILQHNQLSYK